MLTMYMHVCFRIVLWRRNGEGENLNSLSCDEGIKLTEFCIVRLFHPVNPLTGTLLLLLLLLKM